MDGWLQRCCYSIVFIAGITPTNYSVSYKLLSNIQRIRASLATAIYGNKMLDQSLLRTNRLWLDCLLDRR